MTNEQEKTSTQAGQESYQRWKASLQADSSYQAVCDEEAEKSELWLHLVEARQAAGLTQVARRPSVAGGANRETRLRPVHALDVVPVCRGARRRVWT